MGYLDYSFTLDLRYSQSQISIPALLHDTYRMFRISLSDGGKPYLIADGCIAMFTLKRPSGTVLTQFCAIENNTTVVYQATETTFAEIGIHDCEITIFGADNNQITSPKFIIVVSERAANNDDIDLSEEDNYVLDGIMKAELSRREAEESRVANEEARINAGKTAMQAVADAEASANRAEAAADKATADATKATTEEVTRIIGELGVVQTTGASETAVMSQKATTEAIGEVAECCLEKIEHISENRFNPNTAENKWWSSGAFVDTADCVVSDVIPCKFGDTIYAKFLREVDGVLCNTTFHGWLVGADGTIVYDKASAYRTYAVPTSHSRITELKGVRIGIKKSENPNITIEKKETIEVTVNNEPTTFSAYFDDYIEKTDLVEKNKRELEEKIVSRWCGKNLLVFGDSISTDNYPVNEYRYPKWATALKEEIGCNLFNYSVHGYGYLCGQGTVEQGQYNMINQIETAHTELSASGVSPDLIVLFMGTNDYGNVVPIGARGDGMHTVTYMTDTFLTPKYTDPSVLNTFYGAVEHCMARIKELWNNARVVVLTPLQRQYQYNKNEGMELVDYRQIIIDTAMMFSYPIKDLFYEANFCPVNKYDRMMTYRFPPSSTAAGQYDGLHPNEDFCKNRLMPMIQKFIENI